MPNWLIALDIIVTTFWTIALSVAALALWNAADHFRRATRREINITIKTEKGETLSTISGNVVTQNDD